MMGPGGGDPAGPSATGPVSADVEMKAECCSGGEAAAATGARPPMAHLGGDHHLPQQQGPVDGQGGKDWGLLALARQLADEGKPSLALQAKNEESWQGMAETQGDTEKSKNDISGYEFLAYSSSVVMAVKTEGGEHAVVQVLHRARELYRSKVQANAAAEELASLFAQCAIAEANPSGAEPLVVPATGDTTMLPGIDENSILAESGRKQIVLDAFSDGSSFICLQCGGLVSSLRKQEHLTYWCPGQM
ncbi:hypothetical protein Taro_045660 [Colocasia esculenta]|uniref:C2HC zinc finger plants domain-containing protein n=1 Tax=Colocasia esculenta TaxID=4460 RepID=A0A843WQ29_COLES|nr:hypothetical protein [Colocasia esculenta]